MALKDIVTINTGLDTSAIPTAGFGYPLFISKGTYFNERVRSYNSFKAVKEDIPEGTDTYKAALAYFSQEFKPELVYIGRVDTINTVVRLQGGNSGSIYEGQPFSIKIINESDGTEATLTHAATGVDTLTTAASTLAGLISGEPDNPSTAVGTEGTVGGVDYIDITITRTGGNATGVYVVKGMVEISNTYSESITDAYTAIQNVDNSWYTVTLEDASITNVKALAPVIETEKKILFVQTAATENYTVAATLLPIDANDISAWLKEQNYFRTVTQYHDEAQTLFPITGWLGRCLPREAGTITWANKVLSGVGGSSKQSNGLELTNTYLQNLSNKNCNFIQPLKNTTITRQGKVASGEWIDIIRGRDSLDDELEAELQTLQIRNEKIPYTQEGIDLTAGTIRTVLERYVAKGFLESYEINVPKASSIPFADKVTREFDSLTWIGYLSGAIHVTTINGNLTYSEE